MKYTHISVAIPLMAELENIHSIIKCLKNQTFRDFEVFVCVNQPDTWWNDNEKLFVCTNNSLTIKYLQSVEGLKIHIIDRSSQGLGWDKKHTGVGFARKTLFDNILQKSCNNEIIVSLDGDTFFSPQYFQSLVNKFNKDKNLSAIAVPYYHPITNDEEQNRSLLRYEIYMRYYLINMLQIHNIYAFTALGSAMVFTKEAYKKTGGISPLQGGEDFYLMQKFCKTGKISIYNDEIVKPQGRKSFRVPFGTGPAVQKGLQQQDLSYPFYSKKSFKKIEDTFKLFPQLYTNEVQTPMSDFLSKQLKTINLWQPLRKNFKTQELFVKACTERVDGLRILQFLKHEHQTNTSTQNFINFCKTENIDINPDFSFEKANIPFLDNLRDLLFEKETELRKNASK